MAEPNLTKKKKILIGTLGCGGILLVLLPFVIILSLIIYSVMGGQLNTSMTNIDKTIGIQHAKQIIIELKQETPELTAPQIVEKTLAELKKQHPHIKYSGVDGPNLITIDTSGSRTIKLTAYNEYAEPIISEAIDLSTIETSKTLTEPESTP
jgi:hypothetical protein